VKEIKNVAVIGTGTMGVGIIQGFAEAGINVRAIDSFPESLDRGMALIEANLKLFREFDLLKETPDAILARVEPILTTETAEKADGCEFILETIPELLDAKKAIFAQLDTLPTDVVIASNTSSMTVDTLTEGLNTPQRMLGLHYFNPAHIIPAVEIHKGRATSAVAIERTRELMIRTGKKPVIVHKSVPGFIINRLTGAMEREIDYLLDEGVVTPEDLDTAVKASYGFRLSCLGPMEAEDMIGLDTAARVSGKIFKVLSNRTEPSPDLVEKVNRGELGIKSGKGWYDYAGQTREEVNDRINRRLLRQLALYRSVEEQEDRIVCEKS
jgi:3-hydroxybutyryl-CoA dehydrogenase